MAIGLGCLQYVLDEGERYDWFGDTNITITAVIAVLSLAAFAYWELRVVKNPIVDLRILLKQSHRRRGCLMAATLGVLALRQRNSHTAISAVAAKLHRDAFGPLDSHARARHHGDDAGDADSSGSFQDKPPILLGIGFLIITIANFQTAGVITTDSTFGRSCSHSSSAALGSVCSSCRSRSPYSQLGPGSGYAESDLAHNLCQQLGGSIATALLVTLLDRRGARIKTRLLERSLCKASRRRRAHAQRRAQRPRRPGQSASRDHGVCRRVFFMDRRGGHHPARVPLARLARRGGHGARRRSHRDGIARSFAPLGSFGPARPRMRSAARTMRTP